jgi:pyruvate/2-oxoacid:ferredoxin oxidoreductase beta subunit
MADQSLFDDQPTACPTCGDTEVLPLIYGVSSAEMLLAKELGQIALSTGAETAGSPQWLCRSPLCGQAF